MDTSIVLGMIGLIGGLALLITLTMKGVNIIIGGPISALFVALMSGLPLYPQLVEEGVPNFVTSYMTGFTSFILAWYLMFLLGAVFGKVMEDSGAADAVAKWFVAKLGMKFAVLALVRPSHYLNKQIYHVVLFQRHWHLVLLPSQ